MKAKERQFAIGFGLFHGWLITLLTYTGAAPLGFVGFVESAVAPCLLLMGGMISAAAFLLLAGRWERWALYACDSLLVVSICLVLLEYYAPAPPLAMASCVCCGLLCGVLHCLYGLASLSFPKSEFAPIIAFATVVASVVAVAALLVEAYLPVYFQALVLVVLPLVSSLLLRRWREAARLPLKSAAKPEEGAREELAPRFLRLMAAVWLFDVVCRTCDAFSVARHTGLIASSVALFASHIVAALLLVALLSRGRRVASLAYFYRLALPCAGAGFVLLAVPGVRAETLPLAAALLVGVGLEVINLIAWVLASYAALVSQRPARYFGLYVLVTYFAMLVGRLLSGLAMPYVASYAAFFGLICVVALVFVVLVVLPDDQVLLIEESLRLSHEEKVEGAERQRRCESFAQSFGLTERETEVLELLVRGRTLKVVAERLTISKGTAGTHIANIYRKTDVHKQQDLIDLFEGFGN